MKKIMMICLALVLGLGIAVAKNVKEKKTVVYAAEISCNDCTKKIMDNVPSLGSGIDDVQVSIEDQTVTVTYDAAKNNEANILKGLNSLKVNARPLAGASGPYCKIPPVKPEKKPMGEACHKPAAAANADACHAADASAKVDCCSQEKKHDECNAQAKPDCCNAAKAEK